MRPHVSILFGTLLFAFQPITGCEDSTAPLSDASKASPDRRLIGLWQHRHKDSVTYYHIGRLGGKAPEGVMRVVAVGHPSSGELQAPSQLLAFRSDVGGHSYLNIVTGVTQEQLSSIRKEGWKANVLDFYILVKYRVEDDALLVWPTDMKAKKKAIEGGKIKGEIQPSFYIPRIWFTDTTQNVAQFVAAAGDELFSDDPLRFERVR